MDLGKAFLDMLSPDWYTEKDDPFAPVGDYQPFSTTSQVGDTVFAYTLDADDTSHCRLYADALQAASADNPRMYKVYGTITESRGNACTIDSDSSEEIPLRVVDGELCPASQQELYEDMDAEEETEEVEPEIEETLTEEETVDESFFSLFDLDDNDGEEVEEDELTEEDEASLLRMWDGANFPKKSQSNKSNSFSVSQKHSNQPHNKSSFSGQKSSHNQHHSRNNHHSNQQHKSHSKNSAEASFETNENEPNLEEEFETPMEDFDVTNDDFDNVNDMSDDDTNADQSEETGLDMEM